MPSILESQPGLYRDLLPEFLMSEVPEETKATCSSCAMCKSSCGQAVAEEDESAQNYFRPETKCCTYHPNVPNYLIGAVLADDRPEASEGRRRIEEKIRERVGVTPYGINAPAKYSLLYQSSKEFFGRASGMRCPYYVDEQGGLCSIWRYRESVCSTYFCKHVAGADGRKFWMTLKGYLTLVETQLMRYAAFRLEPEYLLGEKHPAEPPARKLTREELEERSPSERDYQKLWGNWVGLEKDFYTECFKIVSSLSKVEVEKILGFDGEASLALLKKYHRAAVFPVLPKKLKLNPDLTVKWLRDPVQGDQVALGGYSELDAVALSVDAFTLLKDFDGQSEVGAVRARWRQEKSTDFADEVLLELAQARVLVE